MYCHSFGVTSLSCTPESLVVFFFNVTFILWNFVWLNDLVEAFKHPMYTTDKNMWLYKMLVYLIAAISSAVALAFSSKGAFAMVPPGWAKSL